MREMLYCECGHAQVNHEFDRWEDLGNFWGTCQQPGCRCEAFAEGDAFVDEHGQAVDAAYDAVREEL